MIGCTEVLPQRLAELDIFVESLVHLFPVAHSVSHNDLESDGVAVFVIGIVGPDDFNGAVEVFHSFLRLGVHLDVRQVHIERHEIGRLGVVHLIQCLLEVLVG